MLLSLGIHGAVLAFASLRVSLFPSDHDGNRMAAADRYLAQRPLEVVRIRLPQTRTRARAPAEAAEPAAEETVESLATVAFEPRVSSSASPAMTLQTVELLPAETPAVEDVLASAEGYTGLTAQVSDDVSFEAASRAARKAERRRKKKQRGGRRQGVTLVVSGMGNCASPAAAVLNVFGGRGALGRRY